MDLLDLATAFSSLPLPRGTGTAIMTWEAAGVSGQSHVKIINWIVFRWPAKLQ